MVETRLKKTAVYTAIFAVLTLGIMFYRASTKSIMIAEATYEGTDISMQGTSEIAIDKPDSDKGKDSLVIPLEAGVSSENITFEEKHAEHQFILYVWGKSSDYYEHNNPVSDLSCIEAAQCVKLNDKGYVCLIFQLDGLYENETALGDREITVTFTKPEEIYDRTVVIEAMDETGKSMVKYIKKQMDGDDKIRIYYTYHKSDEDISSAQQLIEESAADFYIQIGAELSDENETGIKTYYNEKFFIRNFGNVELANILERNTATSAGAGALGLSAESESNELLMSSKIPSAYVSLGNANNSKDKKKISDDSYLENCATGLVNGIREAFSIVDPEAEQEQADDITTIIKGN